MQLATSRQKKEPLVVTAPTQKAGFRLLMNIEKYKNHQFFKLNSFSNARPSGSCKPLAVSVKDETMNFRQQILLYFKPKNFEFFRDKPIYELIGIKTYKKYLPTTGDIVRKRKKITQIKISRTDKITELYKYEKKTRNYEWRHIIGAIIFILLTFVLNKKLTVFDWVFLPILNLYVNIYPIFLQRYNRIRIIKVLQSNGKLSPYDSIDRKTFDE